MALSSIAKGIKNLPVFGSEWERKVKEATSNDLSIADSEILHQIADATYDYHNYETIMSKTWERLDQKPKDWKIVIKTLGLIEALIRMGNKRCVEEISSNKFRLKNLQYFDYVDETQTDRGATIRTKAKSLVEILESEDMVNEMREESRRIRERFQTAQSAPRDMYEERYRPVSHDYYTPPSKSSSRGQDDPDRYDITHDSRVNKSRSNKDRHMRSSASPSSSPSPSPSPTQTLSPLPSPILSPSTSTTPSSSRAKEYGQPSKTRTEPRSETLAPPPEDTAITYENSYEAFQKRHKRIASEASRSSKAASSNGKNHAPSPTPSAGAAQQEDPFAFGPMTSAPVVAVPNASGAQATAPSFFAPASTTAAVPFFAQTPSASPSVASSSALPSSQSVPPGYPFFPPTQQTQQTQLAAQAASASMASSSSSSSSFASSPSAPKQAQNVFIQSKESTNDVFAIFQEQLASSSSSSSTSAHQTISSSSSSSSGTAISHSPSSSSDDFLSSLVDLDSLDDKKKKAPEKKKGSFLAVSLTSSPANTYMGAPPSVYPSASGYPYPVQPSSNQIPPGWH
ncbi:EpsinR-like protein B [Monocercomonoides exilis]|uniref:EpsinR-like protein B n=1 Tax=Monocercomonoides exilis TaxID=2049356 RepID=UPI0035599A74|nr:EpsinR-like protein B [Monocercomonoides exilis]|eukprot:MONOS_1486.1-p1 / transcript=MONOS_1486.1 / gene=MONOS_1486 / organism=Monocercomonoides_exilis_PA203 / gene_product= EpsinR paralogue B / transcript_product= EpsinR paralogue B / location=Mono_scaffold00026:145469-147620(+) / protein_length=569 / sequence_SO=supercontig / SO=protein_coding / is_pseudo=false